MLTELTVQNLPQAYANFAAECAKIGIMPMGEGAMELELRAGNGMGWFDPDEPRLFIYQSIMRNHVCKRNRRPHTHLMQKYVTAPSALHKQSLIWACEKMVEKGYGDELVSYERSGYPLTVLADNVAAAMTDIDGGMTTVTPRKALARLKR